MLLTSLEPPVVKSGGKDPADEIIFAKSAFVLHNPKDFGSSDGMLDLDACPGYLGVGRLLPPGKFLSLRFLRRLYHGDVVGTLPLVSVILLKDAFVRKGIYLVGDTLVVHLSLHCETGKEDESRHAGDHGILDGVSLLFAAVVPLLKVRVGRSRNLALCPVMNELMHASVAPTLVKKPSESRGLVNGVPEHFCQRVYPLAALLLAHVETCRMIALKRVVLQIDKYEKQPFLNRGKRTVGLDCMGTLSCNLFAFDIMPAEIFVMGFSEKRQNFVKKGYADTCECQKRSWIIPCFCIVHPLVNVLVARICA